MILNQNKIQQNFSFYLLGEGIYKHRYFLSSIYVCISMFGGIYMKKHKAMFTLEATIVVPTILIAIFAVLFAFQVLYQYIVIEYAASFGAERGAMLWDYDYNDKNFDFVKGSVGEKEELYFDLFGNKEKKCRKIEDETKRIADSLTLIGGNITVLATPKNSIIGSSVEVTVTQDINIPFKRLITYFGKEDMGLTSKSSASLYDPDEFIRNADYIYELANSIISEVKENFGDINDKIK